MRAARLGITLSSLKVTVHSETDARGMVGIDGISTALSEMRMSIEIGADNVPGQQLRDLAEVGELQSTVNCTLRERPPLSNRGFTCLTLHLWSRGNVIVTRFRTLPHS